MSAEQHPDGSPSPSYCARREGSRHAATTEITVAWTRPASGWIGLELRELRSYRELLYFFARSEVKVRYKQTVLGAASAALHPVLAMVVFSIFFGEPAGIASDGVPYPVFAYTALVPWTYFGNARGGDHESLLPPAGHTAFRGPLRPGRFRHRIQSPVADSNG